MDTFSDQKEIERLRAQLHHARREAELVGGGFLLGGMLIGYFLVPWIAGSARLDTPTMLRLVCLCCVLGGALLSVLLTSLFRLRVYVLLRRSEKERMQGQFSPTNRR